MFTSGMGQSSRQILEPLHDGGLARGVGGVSPLQQIHRRGVYPMLPRWQREVLRAWWKSVAGNDVRSECSCGDGG